jgi:gliding motility-associated-like protein
MLIQHMKNRFTISFFLKFGLVIFLLWGLNCLMAANGKIIIPHKAPATWRLVKDTTVVACEDADTALGTWFNTLQLQIVLPANGRGDSVSVTPNPPSSYSFRGPCGDTIRATFKLYNAARVLYSTKTYVFIAVDKVAPVFKSSVADSLNLSCTDSIPKLTTVKATDNCLLDVVTVKQTEEGGGNCIFRRKIVRTWEARDRCGNTSRYRQVIVITDNLGPDFINFPRDTTLTCKGVSTPQALGTPKAKDLCDPNPAVSYNDQITRSNNASCLNNYDIRRFWQATDVCGNTTFRTQVIRVRDTEAPTYTTPKDTVVDCSLGDDPSVTGFPTNLKDNCDNLTQDNASFEDVVIANRCVNSYTVDRTWRVIDNCGNEKTSHQRIQVVDKSAPVFSAKAKDLILDCSAGLNVATRFQQWLDDRGGARASDNCSTQANQLTWTLLDAISGGSVTAPILQCPATNQVLYQKRVKFIVADECGNRDSTIALFQVVDKVAPKLSACQRDTTIAAAPGECQARISLNLPKITEDCSAGFTFAFAINRGPRTTQATDLPINRQFPVGVTRVSYYVTDCANNIDSCTFTITVVDKQKPAMTCPVNLDTILAQGACTIPIVLRIPSNITDNCGFDANNLAPRYYITGATTLPLTQLTVGGAAPRLNFNLGVSKVYYLITDRNGNSDTCSYLVNVMDQEAPIARCRPTTVFVNPAGLDPTTIKASEIDAGSSDNCSIASSAISPASFGCDKAGTVQNVTLTVTDRAGNFARCSTIVRVETLGPEPTANSGLCGNDTLVLKANPPAANGGTVYTFKWSGPNGFSSTRQNPFIPSVGSKNAGSYVVEITGITVCKATGTIQVAIEDLPLTPTLLAKDIFCAEEDIVLTSSIAPTGQNVTYRWYKGVAPNGVLLGQTIVPSYTIRGPQQESTDSYYLTIETKGCVSPPSAPKTIRVFKRPVAVPKATIITVCENETITLGTEVTGTGITYLWTGPNGFNSTSQFPPAIAQSKPINAGVYTLVISRFGCASDPALVSVNVLPSPKQPVISYSGPVCEGGNITLRTNSTATLYTWLSPDLRPFPTTTQTLDLPNVTASLRGDWRLQLTSQGCSSELSAPLSVVINDLPNPAVSASPPNVCEGAKLELRVTPNIANATYRWTGPSNYSFVGSVATLDNMRQTNAGRYSVTVTTAEGCSGTTGLDIDVKKGVSIINITNDAPRCLSGSTDIRLTPTIFPSDDGTFRYRWAGPSNYAATTKVAVIPGASQLNAGNYQFTVINKDGCISESSTLLNVIDPPRTPSAPKVSATTALPLCSGAPITICTDAYEGQTVTYSWITPTGITPSSGPCFTIPKGVVENTGNYSVFVSIEGCNSRESGEVNLQVGAKPVITAASNSPVCSGQPIELKTTVIPGAQYSWSGPQFNSSLANPVISEADSLQHTGVYGVFAVLNGCRSDIMSTRVEVLPSPKRPELAVNSPLCISGANPRLRLSLRPNTNTPNALYTWFGPNGQSLGNSATTSFDLTSFTGFGNGTYNFTVLARLGTCNSQLSDPFPVVMNTIPADRAVAGQDFTACEATDIQLKGENPSVGTGLWTIVQGDPSGLVTIASPNKAVTSLKNVKGGQSYVFRWTLSNGACENYSSDDVVVAVNKKDTAYAGADITACTIKNIQLSARPAATNQGRWTQSDIQALLGIGITDPTSPTSAITGLQPGNLYSFSWNVSGGCGQAIDEVLVLVSDPDPFAGADKTICNSDGIVQMQAAQPAGGSRGRWRALTPGITFNNPDDFKALARNVQAGRNVFVWEIDNGICGNDSRDTVVITYKKNPKAVGDQINVPFGQEIRINVLANDTVPPGSVITILQPPFYGTLTPQSNGEFVFRPNSNYVGTDRFRYQICSEACDCSQAEAVLEVGKEAGCNIPDIITPNNDGINDTFIVPCLLKESDYPNNQVIIFNSWGDEVFRSPKPYKNNWQGTYNGEELPVGTYFYIVDFGDGKKPQNGFLIIQR